MIRKTLIVISIFIFFTSLVCALKISPTQTQIIMNQYETNCTYIWVLPIENYLISSQWSFDGQGDLDKYKLSKEKIKMSINYSYLSNGRYEICFTPNKAGNISGIIYFYSEKTMIEIGTWVDLKVNEVGTIERVSLITANAIKENNINEMNILLGLVFILLIIIFLLILRKTLRSYYSKNKHP